MCYSSSCRALVRVAAGLSSLGRYLRIPSTLVLLSAGLGPRLSSARRPCSTMTGTGPMPLPCGCPANACKCLQMPCHGGLALSWRPCPALKSDGFQGTQPPHLEVPPVQSQSKRHSSLQRVCPSVSHLSRFHGRVPESVLWASSSSCSSPNSPPLLPSTFVLRTSASVFFKAPPLASAPPETRKGPSQSQFLLLLFSLHSSLLFCPLVILPFFYPPDLPPLSR